MTDRQNNSPSPDYRAVEKDFAARGGAAATGFGSTLAAKQGHLHPQQINQLRHLVNIAKIVNDRETRLDLLFGDTRKGHQGAVLGVDIVPGDPAGCCSLWLEYRACAGAAVYCSYRYRSALPVARDVVGWRDPHPDLVDQLMDHRVADLLGCRVNPREVTIGCPCSEEVGGAVRHVDQIGRVQWPAKRREAGTRYRDALDRFRQDICFSGRIGSSLGESVVGMAARHELDSHVGDDVPGLAQLSGNARAVCLAIHLEETSAGFENAFFCLVPAL